MLSTYKTQHNFDKTQVTNIYEFSDKDIPGFVGEQFNCCFYEGTVNLKLKLPNNTYAPIIDWNLSTECPPFKIIRYENFTENLIANSNCITIINVTKVPENNIEENRLKKALFKARFRNHRFVLPVHCYSTDINLFIGNENRRNI